MSKKGFTLFETIIVLFIILTLFSGVAAMGRFESKIYKNIEYEGFLYEVHNFITYAKLKSATSNKTGSLIITPSKKNIYYAYNNSQASKFVTVPSDIKVFSKEISFPIDSSGRINKAGSIQFENYFNEVKSIKIRVGVDYINFDD
ncbi:prepilin-type N-terminal cleavage/methylation domain-containing protein [Clostridium sp. SM-530-WT-3G]|uniref:prepilin-type N-terminal cleavage/methylation domain-containing protein n=1 Tax=Clostridium sp. SM-530-WT-3G TaxID=2725303 RepID=UPI00145DD1CD|nr:prepilin-type N-terminal cleavage/methylation domain-containing protein [Clostridium sp. SM-530-WT-3G]NME83477.1 prepilin-type N-terminal cleavage/methylation domain-containing protein [Clostridium sp. SM-530-WT-3G]